MLKDRRLYGTTSAGGDATINDTMAIFGLLVAVSWIDGSLADGVDAVLSTQDSEGAQTLLTLTNANNDAVYYPRHDACSSAGTAQSSNQEFPLLAGTLRLVISSGGSAASGGCIVYYLSD